MLKWLRPIPSRLPRLVPAAWRSGGLEGWGHLLDMSPNHARLLTAFPWKPGEEGEITFEIPPEELAALPVRALRVVKDRDGYREVELEFLGLNTAERIQAALLEWRYP